MATLGPSLQRRLSILRADHPVEVHVFMQQNATQQVMAEAAAADSDTPPTRAELVSAIRERVVESQSAVLGFLGFQNLAALDSGDSPARSPTPAVLQQPVQSWSTNSLTALLPADAVAALEAREDVALVTLARRAPLLSLLDGGAAPTPGEAAPTNVSWSVAMINAPRAWAEAKLTGEGVLVAVIDTGINYRHPDLASRMWDGGAAYPLHGYNFDAQTNDPMDEAGHGTSSAGIVAGTGSMGLTTGVAPGATLMALRTGGSESSIWSAIEFALEHHADVISMSMTWKYIYHPNYPAWRRVCDTIAAMNVLHANSSGNQGLQLDSYPVPWNIGAPGNCPSPVSSAGKSSVITVGAVLNSDDLSAVSGIGPAAWNDAPFADYPWNGKDLTGLVKPDVCAPGEATSSCNFKYGNDPTATAYVNFNGTSAATPHVGGALALLAQACKRAGTMTDAARVLHALQASAVKIDGQTSAFENNFGAGRIDVYAAYQYGMAQKWWT